MRSDSDEGRFRKARESFENIEIKVNNLSRVITKSSVTAAGINADTPIVNALIDNLTGTLPTKKRCEKQVKCKICNCNISSYIILENHITGAKHQKKLKDLEIFNKLSNEEKCRIHKLQKNNSLPFMCEICPLEVNSAVQLQNHLSGERHKRKADKMKLFQMNEFEGNRFDKSGRRIHLESTSEKKLKQNERNTFPCHICNVFLNSKIQLNEHVNSRKHKIKEELRQKLKYSQGEKSERRVYLVH